MKPSVQYDTMSAMIDQWICGGGTLRGSHRLLRAIALVGGALLASTDFALGESSATVLYKASFEDYSQGEALDSTKGTSGGSWGDPAVPEEAETVAIVSASRHYMSYVSMNEGLAFTPDNDGERKVRNVELSVLTAGFANLPTPPDGVKTALALHIPTGESGSSALVAWGWSDAEQKMVWNRLKSSTGTALSLAYGWYVVTAKFRKFGDGTLRVQFSVCLEGGSKVLLTTEDGLYWLQTSPSGTTERVVDKIELRGDGGVEYLKGGEPPQGLSIGIRRR